MLNDHPVRGRRRASTTRVVNVNGDRYPDARTTNRATGEVNYFVNTGTVGGFLLVRAPDANTDRITLTDRKGIAIDVLANDFAGHHADIVITTAPRYGTVQVLSDRRILYRSASSGGRTDRFTYQVTEEDRRSSATVYIRLPRLEG